MSAWITLILGIMKPIYTKNILESLFSIKDMTIRYKPIRISLKVLFNKIKL